MKINKRILIISIMFFIILSLLNIVKATNELIINDKLTYKEIDDSSAFISGFEIGIKVEDIKSGYFDSKYNIKIYNSKDIEVTENNESLLGTGYKIELYENNNLIKTYKTIVYGDTNGDASINAIDALAIVKNKLGKIPFKSEEFLEAGRVNNSTRTSGAVPSSTDALLIVKYRLHPEKYEISQSIFGKIEDIGFEDEIPSGIPVEPLNPEEDEDKDGLTNAEEEELGTNPYSIDTDMDGLPDSYEVKESNTNPLVADTDGDRLDDGNELVLGLNPLQADSKGDGINDGDRTLEYTIDDEESGVQININGKGNIASTDVEVLEDIFEEENGILNKVYNFTTEGTMNNATVKIPYTLNEIEAKGINESNLTVYYLNINDSSLEEISTEVNTEEKELTANLEHFSYYLIGDKTSSKNVKLNELLDYDGDGYYDGLVLADSGFKPEIHGFSFKNYGTVKSPKGHCAGMARFAMLYYRNQLPIVMEDGAEILPSDKEESFANGYDLSGTYFENGENLYNYKIKTSVLNCLFNKMPSDFYEGYDKEGNYVIKEKYREELENIGATYENYKLKFDENNENFIKNASGDDAQLFKALWRLYILQATDEETYFHFKGAGKGKVAYDELFTYLRNGIPVYFSFTIPNAGGHAVNAIQLIDDLDGDTFKIAIYDNNYSGETRYIYVKKKKLNPFVGYYENSEAFGYEGNYGVYKYLFEYDWNNDGIKEKIEDVAVIKYEEKEENKIYATVYDDGTLTLSSTNRKLEGKNVVKQYDNIKENIYNVIRFEIKEKGQIKYIDVLDKIKINKADFLFSYYTNLQEIRNIENLDTSEVTSMFQMFGCCENLLNIDVGKLNTSKVTNMSEMFFNSPNLETINLNGLDTSKVTNMYGMFWNCKNLASLDLSKLDTSNVTTMEYMFCDCDSLKSINLDGFNTSKVTNMRDMFSHCSSLENLDVTGFNTENVTTMQWMFYSCESLKNLNVSNFNTSNVKSMYQMFDHCKNLLELNVNNFDTSNVTSIGGIFDDCKKLTKLDLSSFDTNKVNGYTGTITDGCNNLIEITFGDKWTEEIVLHEPKREGYKFKYWYKNKELTEDSRIVSLRFDNIVTFKPKGAITIYAGFESE